MIKAMIFPALVVACLLWDMLTKGFYQEATTIGILSVCVILGVCLLRDMREFNRNHSQQDPE